MLRSLSLSAAEGIGLSWALRPGGISNLLKQGRDLGTVMRPASSQIRCDDLTCISVNSQVQLSPCPVSGRFLHMTDVNPESRAVDEQVDRSIRGEPAKPSDPERLEPPR